MEEYLWCILRLLVIIFRFVFGDNFALNVIFWNAVEGYHAWHRYSISKFRQIINNFCAMYRRLFSIVSDFKDQKVAPETLMNVLDLRTLTFSHLNNFHILPCSGTIFVCHFDWLPWNYAKYLTDIFEDILKYITYSDLTDHTLFETSEGFSICFFPAHFENV